MKTDSNTSHVIVYLVRKSERTVINRNSNTSHVIVYLVFDSFEFSQSTIQIHLMLLFITSYLPVKRNEYSIQIHLMLLFIESPAYNESCLLHSNTSHVIVYLCRDAQLNIM